MTVALCFQAAHATEPSARRHRIRATGTGLSWNIGFALGGMTPTLVTLASGTTANIPNVLAIFTAAVFAVYLLGSLIVPETRGEFR